jgi:hypothetical protein
MRAVRGTTRPIEGWKRKRKTLIVPRSEEQSDHATEKLKQHQIRTDWFRILSLPIIEEIREIAGFPPKHSICFKGHPQPKHNGIRHKFSCRCLLSIQEEQEQK